MDAQVIKAVEDTIRKPMQIGSIVYAPHDWKTHDPASLVTAGPQAKAVGVVTLGAVRDYLAANKDGLDLQTLLVQIVSPSRVDVLGPLDARSRSREVFLSAVTADLANGFLGSYLPLETFIVGLQVRFADSDDRKKILQLLSNVKHEKVQSALDDGVTQVVQARAGVALVSDVAVPNPVTLAPFRTFRDVPPVSSLFVLRLQSGPSGGLPQAGLFEADGGAWQLTAIGRLRDWLTEALTAGPAILA